MVQDVNQFARSSVQGLRHLAETAAPGSVAATVARLARIGECDGGGVRRVAWSAELFAAYDFVGEQMRALGLEVSIDPAGNLIGRWNAGSGAPVVVGSHLDTVPSGGAFDGALGVVSAVHAVRLLKEQEFEPEKPVWIVAFMDEEGTRFGAALFGSRAFTGEDVSSCADRIDDAGVSLRDAMMSAGFDPLRVSDASVDDVAAYIELHVEQGPVLESEGLEIGVVTSIVGLRGYRVRLRGQANHAGTTPMRLRRDALAGAARIALELRAFARARDSVTANVGKIAIEPGGANVVPGYADFTIDVRAPSHAALAELERHVEETVASVAEEEQLEVDLEPTFALDPVTLDAELVEAVERAAEAERASWRRLPSGAGHDAMVVARAAPTAMIFVPSRDGVSHAPEEYTSPEHMELGMRVLASTLRQALERGGG